MREGSEEEQEGFTKTVIPNGDWALYLYCFHFICPTLHGRRREDEGCLIVLYVPHSTPARKFGSRDSLALRVERVRGECEEREAGVVRCGVPMPGPWGRKSKAC